MNEEQIRKELEVRAKEYRESINKDNIIYVDFRSRKVISINFGKKDDERIR